MNKRRWLRLKGSPVLNWEYNTVVMPYSDRFDDLRVGDYVNMESEWDGYLGLVEITGIDRGKNFKEIPSHVLQSMDYSLDAETILYITFYLRDDE